MFPHPVRELRAALPKAVIAYDASHVMGVVAGGQFQSPIAEGADLIQGSTHKSLFGPQKGLFVFADEGPVNERNPKHRDPSVRVELTSAPHRGAGRRPAGDHRLRR